jgi:phenylacetate-CoA ligase
VSDRLGVPVRNIYSAVECGNIAFECEHGALHLNADSLVVECLVGGKPARPGETGEVVVTTLDMYSAPLIRYRLGDLAIPGDGLCACGRGLPWLRAVTGRTIDCIRLPGGQTIPGTAFGEAIFKDVRSVRQYRITQRSLAHFAIELVPGSGFSDETETAIRRRCHETVGMDVQVDLACVACIPREPNGKARYVVSRVSGGRP